MEKTAYKLHGPLEETTRHNIRKQLTDQGGATEEQDVYSIRKRPLSAWEIQSSPKQGDKTFLLVEERKMKAASKEQEELEEMKQRISALEQMVASSLQRTSALEQVFAKANLDLYEPLYGHRVQATVSLMVPVRDTLDRFVESAINQEVKNAKGEAARREVEGRFESKKTYLQLMQSHDPIVERIVTSAENSLLAKYEKQGISTTSITKHVDVKKSMRVFKRMLRIRNQTAHIFDYDFEDASRASTEEKKDSWTIQAKILKDIEKALNVGWLPEFMDPEEEDEGLLHLQLQSKVKELEAMSHCTLDELADMPCRAIKPTQKRRKMAPTEKVTSKPETFEV